MSLFDRVFDAFQFMAQLGPKMEALKQELAKLDRETRALESRVVRLETIVEITRGERLPEPPRLLPAQRPESEA